MCGGAVVRKSNVRKLIILCDLGRIFRKSVVLLIGLFIEVGGQAYAVSTIQLTPSRTSGVAPLSVFFDATGTTGTGTNRPFHDLHYAWDFGDSGSGNWTVSGKSKNKGFGPVTAHVFEAPGTYTVKLTVTDINGSKSTKQVSITVQNPNSVFSGTNTVCFSTSGDFSGCPSGAKKVTTSSFQTVMNNAGSNKRLLLRAGQTWNSSSKEFLNGSKQALSSFGSGARPKVKFNFNGTGLELGNGSDVRVVGLTFQGNSGNDSIIFEAQRKTTNVLIMDNNTVKGTFHNAISMGGNPLDIHGHDIHDKLSIVDSTFVDFGFGSGGSLGFLAVQRLSLQGNTLDDSRGGEHVVRIQHGEKAIISHNYFARQSNLKSLLTIRNRNQNDSCSAGCGRDTKEIVISDNFFYSVDDMSVRFVGKNKSSDSVHGRDFIVERNYFARHPNHANESQVALDANGDASHVTLRNNIVVMEKWETYRALESTASHVRAYNNTCYSPDNPGKKIYCVRFRGGSDLQAYNNLQYVPAASNAEVIDNDAGAQLGDNIKVTANPFISSVFNEPDHFMLKTTASNLINTGTVVANRDDFGFLGRPQGGGFDIGAYEVSSGGSGTGFGPVETTAVGQHLTPIILLLLED